MLILPSMTACLKEQEKTDEPLPEYYEAYAGVLTEFMNSDKNQFDDAAFVLAYIDDDDIPELLVSDTYAKSGIVSIYTYNLGEAVLVDTAGTNGLIYFNERSGMYVAVDEDMVCSGCTVTRMNATSIEKVWTGRSEKDLGYASDPGEDAEIRYFSENEEVDEATYNALLGEYMPEDIKSNADGYPLTEENINSIFR